MSVYCQDCKFLVMKESWLKFECTHSSNTQEVENKNWFGKHTYTDYNKKPKELNKKMNCKNFELEK